jgi:hypothetical protein
VPFLARDWPAGRNTSRLSPDHTVGQATMVSITIESSKKKLSRAPDLPYTLAFPDPNVTTIKDVKQLLSVKYPKVLVFLSPLDI